MYISVASGKGGTGKTTVATALALALAGGSRHRADGGYHEPLLLLDCDVEAPDAHIFVRPDLRRCRNVTVPVPAIDVARCTLCGRCVEVCRFHAMALLADRVVIFPSLCHGCGGCTLACPESAIAEHPYEIGVLEAGPAGPGITFARGVLHIGEPHAVPVIQSLLRWAREEHPASEPVILDAPPGTSCPAVAAVADADYVLLVTEPTPFGLHDLDLMAEAVSGIGIPAGVILNRDGIGDNRVEHYCRDAGLPVLLRIPFSRATAEGLARGHPLTDLQPGLGPALRALYRWVAEEVDGRDD
jgi:MinD superfamily P-loop ATPase